MQKCALEHGGSDDFLQLRPSLSGSTASDNGLLEEEEDYLSSETDIVQELSVSTQNLKVSSLA